MVKYLRPAIHEMKHPLFPPSRLMQLKDRPIIRRCAGGRMKSRRIGVAIHKRAIYGRLQLSQFVVSVGA